MGEGADNILDGICCQFCGGWMEDMFTYLPDGKTLNHDMWDNPPGHPRTCEDCKKEVNK